MKGIAKRFTEAKRTLRRAPVRSALLDDESGAMAATYGLALFALVGAAGVAWDWNRLTTLDSELQAAADQAALAAATQLDGQSGAIARATAAASNLVNNATILSNDGKGTAIEVDTLTFYSGYDQAADSYKSATSADGSARVVKIVLKTRDAVYTMTPVVSLLRRTTVPAEATASLGSAICNTPPVFMCNPLEEEPGSPDFNPASWVGRGLRLITDDAGAPGNFGFLRNGLGNGTPEVAKSLGWDRQPGECVPGNGVTTEPGLKDVVFNALNTRFDLDVNGANTCPGGGANCSAAANVRKDLVKGNGAGNCGVAPNDKAAGQTWRQATKRYRPGEPLTGVEVMGLPRDDCHGVSLTGNCGLDKYNTIGDGNWNRDAYFQVNFGWDSATWKAKAGMPSNPTRYQVYKWEIANPTLAIAAPGTTVGASKPISSPSGFRSNPTPVCRATGDANRRVITAAVINCKAQGVAGHKEGVQVAHWIEVFLVEPPYNRSDEAGTKYTDANDVYVEVIRAVDVGDDGNVGQVVRRDIPYLIR
ncbi:pilus assembly protein [Qipengyuania sp. 6B39]|uniref:pilus assembly protein TadG-related protein n=1 Tax=Qipengyuania proteolytica TaxID=2867239 RepID=UPI001C89ECBE|nr:pilus assembly protein TadG-related protein [Qipengyuania proteolytica]MBX7495007.1 pilus assembly protein [Qipengyuania proteolytica]